MIPSTPWVQHSAWAIDTRSDEAHGFVGVLWFRGEPAPHLAGCPTALFRTRREAYAALRKVKPPRPAYQAFPKARVVRVYLSIDAA